jgi:hypothetical protein
MKYMTTEFHGRKVILLSGAYSAKQTNDTIDIEAPDKLLDVARRYPTIQTRDAQGVRRRW